MVYIQCMFISPYLPFDVPSILIQNKAQFEPTGVGNPPVSVFQVLWLQICLSTSGFIQCKFTEHLPKKQNAHSWGFKLNDPKKSRDCSKIFFRLWSSKYLWFPTMAEHIFLAMLHQKAPREAPCLAACKASTLTSFVLMTRQCNTCTEIPVIVSRNLLELT